MRNSKDRFLLYLPWVVLVSVALFLAGFGIADLWAAEYNQKVEERAASIPSMACNRDINADCSEWSPPPVDTFTDVTVPVLFNLIYFVIGIGITCLIIWQAIRAKRKRTSK